MDGVVLGSQADSPDEWLALAEKSRQVALFALTMPDMGNVAWSHSGFACECLLKAAIMITERFNSWPSRSRRPDLYTHDLEKLAKLLNWKVGIEDEIAPSWAVVTQWRREAMYYPTMNKVVANSLFDAVFGEKGVAKCLSQTFLMCS